MANQQYERRQPAVLNMETAHVLWELIDTTITFRKVIRRWPKNDTLGFADLDISLERFIPGMKFAWRNLVVRQVGDKFRLDMLSEKGKDGKWYPVYYPLSYELREVLTKRVFAEPEVAAAVLELPQHQIQASRETPTALATAQASVPSGNGPSPFAPNAIAPAGPAPALPTLAEVLESAGGAGAAQPFGGGVAPVATPAPVVVAPDLDFERAAAEMEAMANGPDFGAQEPDYDSENSDQQYEFELVCPGFES